jgi:hypothetical protein
MKDFNDMSLVVETWQKATMQHEFEEKVPIFIFQQYVASLPPCCRRVPLFSFHSDDYGLDDYIRTITVDEDRPNSWLTCTRNKESCCFLY